MIKKQWVTRAGYPAAVLFVRNSHHCGYVQIPEGHPLHGGQDVWDDAVNEISVHGGITYGEGKLSIDGKPIFEDPKGWVLGFDCAHSTDVRQGERLLDLGAFLTDFFEDTCPERTFKDVDFCVGECERMADQLKEKADAVSEMQ